MRYHNNDYIFNFMSFNTPVPLVIQGFVLRPMIYHHDLCCTANDLPTLITVSFAMPAFYSINYFPILLSRFF
ncbi:hypothetical protein CS542_10755 [Pedobacter sp. IW39]|nr:hypothetical protein CS542_10755 [Pedobacter sp. IW39]